MAPEENPGRLDVLLSAARNGDPAAQRQLYERFRSTVEPACRAAVLEAGSDLSVRDLIQEVWLRIWERLGQFSQTADDGYAEARFGQWLRQTAHSVICNLLAARRTQRRSPPGRLWHWEAEERGEGANGGLSPLDPAPGPSAQAAAREMAAQLQKAMDERLDDVQRTIVHLVFFEQQSLRVVSERLGMGYDKVRRQFHDALAGLQRAIQSGEGAE